MVTFLLSKSLNEDNHKPTAWPSEHQRSPLHMGGRSKDDGRSANGANPSYSALIPLSMDLRTLFQGGHALESHGHSVRI